MLRKRSRQVTSKEAIISDQSNHSWLPLETQTKHTSFFITSPKFFKNFFTSTSQKIDPMLSPTSILDTNPFSVVSNFWVIDNTKNSSNKTTKTTQIHQQHHAWEQPNNKQGISLALVDENLDSSDDNNDGHNNSNDKEVKQQQQQQQKRKLVVFGSQLRIQVPSISNSSVFPCFSPESPREFGIKTPKNNIWPFGNKNSSLSQVHPEESLDFLEGNRVIPRKEGLSMSDIDEQSEDYTCVISHGPNPKTTHIFGNCIVESCCGKIAGSSCNSSKRNGYFSSLENSIPSQVSFLSFCHHCKMKLGEGRDIYMYRGEKAFCSEECRYQEMLFDGVES